MASSIKVDIVRPTATNGDLSLKGDSGGDATTNGVTVDSSGNTTITGTTTVSSLVATTADITGGTIDNAAIGGTTPAVGSFTQVNADTIKPTTTNGSLSLKGDSGGSATSSGITINSNGDTTITGNNGSTVSSGDSIELTFKGTSGKNPGYSSSTSLALQMAANVDAGGGAESAILFKNTHTDSTDQVVSKISNTHNGSNRGGNIRFYTNSNSTANSLTERMSITQDGVVQVEGTLKADTIGENTSETGVTVDGVLLKDGAINVGDGAEATPSIANTGNTNTGIYFPAADTVGVSTNGSERIRIDSSGNLKFNSGYGSVATAYGCRAWVNFRGTSQSGTATASGLVSGQYTATVISASEFTVVYSGTTYTINTSGNHEIGDGEGVDLTVSGTTVTIDTQIRASGNVSSITDNGTGNYTVNFTNAMPDANYGALAGDGAGGTTTSGGVGIYFNNYTTTSVDWICRLGLSYIDVAVNNVAIFR